MQTEKIGIIADDFTGAMDMGAKFAAYGFETSFAISSTPAGQAVVLNTASREITPQEARERCIQAVRKLHGRSIYKKVDSLLRGHVGAELEGLLQECSQAKIVVCSISPHHGHVYRNGQIYVWDDLLENSIFKDDPAFPAHTSSISARVGVPSTHLGFDTVRGPIDDLAQAMRAAPEKVVTVDAETWEDLHQISQAILINDFLPCGGGGLASVWAEAVSGQKPFQVSAPDLKGNLLIVSGSANIRAHEQIAALASHPESLIWKIEVPLSPAEKERWFDTIQASWDRAQVVALCPGRQEKVRDAEWLRFSQTVSLLAQELIQRLLPAFVLINGGETANRLCELLDVNSVQMTGEVLPGIPYGRVIGGLADGSTLLTKAGGNGAANTLEEIVYGSSIG